MKGDAYEQNGFDRIHWCNSHGRRARWLYRGKPCCDPLLGGIMIPCDTVDITDDVEIGVPTRSTDGQ